MAYNSSGVFSRVHDFTDDRDNGIRIQASRMDAEMDGIATGLSTAITKNGSQTTTAIIPFAVGLSIIDNQSAIFGTNSDYTLQYDEATRDSLFLTSNIEGAAFKLTLAADQGDDASDEWQVGINTSGVLSIGNDIASAQTYVSQLTLTPHATVASSTTAVLGNLTVGGNLTLGSGAVLAEAELELLDGITAGTSIATKVVTTDANIDNTGMRNLTITGELAAATLDISGNIDIDGTANLDIVDIDGAVNIAAATTIDGANKVQFRDTGIFLNSSTDGQLDIVADTEIQIAATTVDINGAVALNGAITGATNITLSGELDAATGDFSGDVDVDGTLEADAITIGGTAVGSIFSPIAGGTGILTTGALDAGSITSGFGIINNGASAITTTGVGTFASLDISGAIDVDGTSNLDVVDIDGAVDMATTLQVDGVATFTARDIHSGGITIANAGQIGSVGDPDAIAIASDGVVTLTQKLIGTELDISGNIDVDGTTNLDIVDIDGAVDMASTLAVAGVVTANAGVVVDEMTLDADTLTATDDFTIDAVGNITLDADGGSILLKDGGTQFGLIAKSSDGLGLFASVADKDIFFKGTDGSSAITALTLDMSAGGLAIFNAGLAIGGTGAANTLDDYEEGTWTPTLQNYGGTPTIESAIYTKVGRLVYASCAITLDGTSDASGFAILTLPFTSLNTDSSAQGGVVTFTDSDKDDITIMQGNNSAAASVMQTDGSTYTYNEFGNDKQLRCIIIYSTA